MKAGSTAKMRTVAVDKAEEILELMRSNNRVLRLYEGAGADNGCNVAPFICTPAQMAQQHLFDWDNELKAVLPDDATTTGTITYTAPNPGAGQPLSQVIVTVSWQERSSEDQSMVTLNFTATAQMICDNVSDPIDPATDPACL